MNKHEATELTIRLIAIFNLASIVSTIPALVSVIDVSISLKTNFPYNPWVTGFFGIIMPVLISLFLWFNANSLSKWIWRQSPPTDEQEKSPTTTQIQIVLFTSIGLYIFLSSLPNLLKFVVYIGQKMMGGSFVGLSDYAFVIGYVIQMFISLWLIFGSNRIVKIIQRSQKIREK
jgi:hypothetical protein